MKYIYTFFLFAVFIFGSTITSLSYAQININKPAEIKNNQSNESKNTPIPSIENKKKQKSISIQQLQKSYRKGLMALV